MSNSRLVAGVAILVAVGGLLYLLAPVLTPFVVAALLAYLGNPAVEALGRLRLPRVAAVLVVFLLFVALFAGGLLYLVPLVRDAVAALAARVPGYVAWLAAQLPAIEAALGVELALDPEALRRAVTGHWQELGGWATRALGVATQSGAAVLGFLVALVLVPVVTFYLLLDWPTLLARVDAALPPASRARVRRLARETDAVLGSFLRGQLTVMAVLAAFYSIGLSLVGLDLAVLIGLVAGAVSFVPYLGVITGLSAAGVAAWIEFHQWGALAGVAAVFVAGQLLEGLVLTPRLVGGKIGLHPVVVIFAVMAGGSLFGFFGVLAALPAAAALKVWLRHARELWVEGAPPAPRRRPPRP